MTSPGGGRPPRFVQWLLGRLLPADDRDELLGDLTERYAERTRAGRPARAWYLREAATLPLWIWRDRARRLDADVLEIRPVLRRLLRSPGFTAVAVASLGLGIGANTAIYSVLHALVYERLAVDRPEELVFPYHHRPEGFQGGSNLNSSQTQDPETGVALFSNVTHPIFRTLRAELGNSAPVAGYTFLRGLSVVDGDRPALAATGALVSGNYFDVLGLDVVVGRPLQEADDRPDAPLVAVLSHSYWQSAFGGDPTVGRVVRVNGRQVEIVGVSRPGFEGISPGGFFPRTQITLPLSAQPTAAPAWARDHALFAADDVYWIRLLARVPADAPDGRAEQVMTRTLRDAFVATGRIAAGEEAGVHARLLAADRGLDTVRVSAERPLLMLAGVVLLVLLVACANVATLLLARGSARHRELAVRRALGASRTRVVWPLFLESVVLAVAGGAVGVFLAWWGAALVAGALTAGMGVERLDLSVDGGMLAVVTGVAVGAALLSGLVPALRLSATDPGEGLGGRGAASTRTGLLHGLLVLQIAISMPLVVGGGLLLRTVSGLTSIDPGFDATSVTVFAVDLGTAGPDVGDPQAALARLVAAVENVPGVSRAALVENVMLSGWGSNTRVSVDGADPVSLDMNAVGPGFFDVYGVPLVAGRLLNEDDGPDAPPVVVVNETAARDVFGGRAVGRTFQRGERTVRVVGVVGDLRYRSLRDDAPAMFFDPMAQRGGTRAHVAVRSATSGPALERALRDAAADVVPGVPLTDVRTQEAQIRSAMGRERVFAWVLALFGAFALFLAAIGLHGITAFAVARRRGEMGVRLALGATPSNVSGLVLRRVAALAAVGLGLGLLGAWLAGPLVASVLYDVEPTDPSTFAAAGATLLAVALLAGWLPARRAARTDPLEVLGAE